MGPMGGASTLTDLSMGGAFTNRREAGRALAAAIRAQIPDLAAASQAARAESAWPPPPGASPRPPATAAEGEAPQPAPAVVLGLPRGGVPVAFEVADALGAPLDVLVARKIGAPGNPELGIGAVAEGGVEVLSNDVLGSLLVSQDELEHGAARARQELQERVSAYRAGRERIPLSGRTAIVVDDGLATGGTARAAVRAARAMGAVRVILAVPVGARSTVRALRAEADDVLCVLEPEPLWAIGAWYADFSQVPDEDVRELLARAQGAGEAAASAPGASQLGPTGGGTGGDPIQRIQVSIPFAQGGMAFGDLWLPDATCCLTLFVHGSGSSRRSPRNRQVAEALNNEGIATLLFDLLTPEEELLRSNIFDIELLAERMLSATAWARGQAQLRQLPIGYFGASTGAAAALWAAALGDQIGAVVSRGGRPDLAAPRLAEVTTPVLLIVGGADTVVMELNRQALAELRCVAELSVVEGATHLFEEPGALERVAALAVGWLKRHLAGAPR